MPRGFIGQPATKFLTQAATVHSRAIDNTTRANQRVSSSVPQAANTADRFRSRQLPFEPSEGVSGGLVPTGRGNSSNIVVSQAEYETSMRVFSQSDDRFGECVYNATNEIEEICRSIFILPNAVPRCLNISDTVKRSLGQFRAVAEDVALQTRAFARDITSLG